MASFISRRRLAVVLVATAIAATALAAPLSPPLSAQQLPPKRAAPAPQMMPIGTFVAARIDRETLPVTDRVVDEDGTLYLIEFDRLVLSLRADFTFRASVRFRRTLFSADERGRSRETPLQSMTVTGRWSIGDTTIRFIPDPSADSRGLRILAGSVGSLREMRVPFHYRNGTQERERTLVLQRRDNIL